MKPARSLGHAIEQLVRILLWVVAALVLAVIVLVAKGCSAETPRSELHLKMHRVVLAALLFCQMAAVARGACEPGKKIAVWGTPTHPRDRALPFICVELSRGGRTYTEYQPVILTQMLHTPDQVEAWLDGAQPQAPHTIGTTTPVLPTKTRTPSRTRIASPSRTPTRYIPPTVTPQPTRTSTPKRTPTHPFFPLGRVAPSPSPTAARSGPGQGAGLLAAAAAGAAAGLAGRHIVARFRRSRRHEEN